MWPFLGAFGAFILMLLGAAAGVALRRAVPHHLNEHAKDVVRLGSALVATIAALVLGLLINSANGTYEAQRSEVRQLASDLILLDSLLEAYGEQTHGARQLLREAIGKVVDQTWEGKNLEPGATPLSGRAPVLFAAIRGLSASTSLQQTLQDQAVETVIRLSRSRLALYERSKAGLPAPVLCVLLFWLMALFASFSLFAPLNPISIAALALVALCASGALFLILEMERPFDGVMHISPRVLLNALPPLAA